MGAGTSAEEFFLKSINVESIFEFVERTDYLFLYSIKECVEKSDCHEGVYLSEVAEYMKLSIPETSKMVKSLENKGYIIWKLDEKKERTYIIATHLIEEIENIIEEVVIIDKGKVQVQSSVDELIGSGYSVSGLKETVDRYCHDKNVIGYDTLHDIKIAYILGDKTKETGWENLNFSGMSLQKIFIKMTGDEGEI